MRRSKCAPSSPRRYSVSRNVGLCLSCACRHRSHAAVGQKAVQDKVPERRPQISSPSLDLSAPYGPPTSVRRRRLVLGALGRRTCTATPSRRPVGVARPVMPTDGTLRRTMSPTAPSPGWKGSHRRTRARRATAQHDLGPPPRASGKLRRRDSLEIARPRGGCDGTSARRRTAFRRSGTRGPRLMRPLPFVVVPRSEDDANDLELTNRQVVGPSPKRDEPAEQVQRDSRPVGVVVLHHRTLFRRDRRHRHRRWRHRLRRPPPLLLLLVRAHAPLFSRTTFLHPRQQRHRHRGGAGRSSSASRSLCSLRCSISRSLVWGKKFTATQGPMEPPCCCRRTATFICVGW